ncbi:MAG: flagellar export chaperone FlgN [Ruminococcus flavefaciens]|nr:flagellar export chaperone FlgN [Ruminococcus flavefaciens]
MLNNYLNILKESLEKKLEVLGHIEEISQVQTEILKSETLDMEAFDRTVDEKDTFVTELVKLDEGFESLYDRIKEELLDNRSDYAEQIKHLQKLVSEVTDKNVSIQAKESRNKAMLESYFAKERQDLGRVRKSSNAAYGYYKNMSGKQADSVFLDKKK